MSSSFISFGSVPFFHGQVNLPDNTAANRGKFIAGDMRAVALAREADDPLGAALLTITGAKPGTEIQIFSSLGVRLDGVESAGASQAFTLPRYGVGDARNTVRVLIVSLGFENIDLDVTVGSTPTTIPIFQRKDRTYRNPT